MSDLRVSYKRTEKSAELPGDPGVLLSVDRVIEALPNARALLRGSFLLPARPSDVVSEADIDHVRQNITAVVPISLLVIGSEDAIPEMLSLVVPSFQPIITRDGKSLAAGYFSIDLARMGSFLQRPQTYFIYAFSDEILTPAAIMAVVDPRSR